MEISHSWRQLCNKETALQQIKANFFLEIFTMLY